MEAVIEHIVDLKNMDKQLNQFKFPDADFSSPNIRRQYTNFEIPMYRDTLDDPAFNVQALDDFARSYEQKLNEMKKQQFEEQQRKHQHELVHKMGESKRNKELKKQKANTPKKSTKMSSPKSKYKKRQKVKK